ncbi:MAG: SIMPL domain-containing protein [Candidatus Moraniibacteriota bacterium]
MDQKQMCNCEKLHPGKIIGISIIAAAAIFSWAFYQTRSTEDTLSVTGSAKQRVTSDTIKWTGNFSRTVLTTDLKSGYDQMDQDLRIVKRFFADQGITDKGLAISPITMDQPSSYNQSADTPREYVLKQVVEIQSNDVAKITALAKSIQPLINQGVIFSTQSVEYYYSTLPDLRVQMLGEAVKDAKVRADEIAKSSGRKAGALKSAGMGVVQLLPVNSVEVSDYGAYDTSSIEKEAMVTVKTSFTLK